VVFCVTKPYSSVGGKQRFGGTCCLHFQGRNIPQLWWPLTGLHSVKTQKTTMTSPAVKTSNLMWYVWFVCSSHRSIQCSGECVPYITPADVSQPTLWISRIFTLHTASIHCVWKEKGFNAVWHALPKAPDTHYSASDSYLLWYSSSTGRPIEVHSYMDYSFLSNGHHVLYAGDSLRWFVSMYVIDGLFNNTLCTEYIYRQLFIIARRWKETVIWVTGKKQLPQTASWT
jgi:hypothetical protein